MSRCFPYPPPGYEKRARTDPPVNFSEKGLRKHRKHKKHGQEKTDKDKEKKDRKGKHKHRKKDKDNRRPSPESRITADVHHKENPGESCENIEEVYNSKFALELDRRIKDDAQKSAIRSVDNSGNLVQRGHGIVQNGISAQNERHTVSNTTVIVARAETVCHRKENLVVSVNRGTDLSVFETAKQKKESTNNLSARNHTGIDAKGNEHFQLLVKSHIISVQRNSGVQHANSVAQSWKDMGGREAAYRTISSPTVKVQGTNDCKHGSAGSFQNCIPNKIEEHVPPAMAIEKKVHKLLSCHTCATANDGKYGTFGDSDNIAGSSVDANSKGEKREKKEKKKNKDREDKKKKKDKDKKRHRKSEKEKEKVSDKCEESYNKYDEYLHSTKNTHQVNSISLKLVSPSKENIRGDTGGDVGAILKRKHSSVFGFLQEHDTQPSKVLRTALTSIKDRTLLQPQAPAIAAEQCAMKAEMPLDNKHTNGIVEAQNIKPYSVVVPSENETHKRAWHSDEKFLRQVYNVPKMDEWPPSDAQEWLFTGALQQTFPGGGFVADRTQCVWDEALQISSEEVVALPYVVPF